MGYVVLHLDKSPGNESAMTDHIERNVIHPNVDPTRIHLNKELIKFPEGINNRTEAIQHRLKTVGLTRQVGKNQVQVIRFMLSGSHEDMERIQQEGKLDEWCKDNIDWLKNTYGAENVVSATLHMDETTPHIHASVVPIVQGERRQKESRKKKQLEPTNQPKRKYKKKNLNRVRLCCDDVMAKAKLIEYQDSYGEAMSKYGLMRGIKGSGARHISLTEFYRSQAIESQNLQTNIEMLLAVEDAKRQSIEDFKQKEQEARLKFLQTEQEKLQKESELKKTEENLNHVKGQLKTEELKSKVADVGSNIMDGIGSMIGSSKIKKQQKEIETLQSDKELLAKEVQQLKQNIQTIQKEHNSIVEKLKQELKKIYDVFPKIKELLRIENLCRYIGFSEEMAKKILEMKPVEFEGKLYSPEYRRDFKTDYSTAQVKEHPTDKEKLNFTIDGVSETNWFRQKYKEIYPTMNIKQNIKSNSNKL